MPKPPLYAQLAQDIQGLVGEGVLKEGDRLPSIREASAARRLSITTVRRAYQLLESQGVVRGKPQSGYFVSAVAAPASSVSRPSPAAADSPSFDAGEYVLTTLRTIRAGQAVPLASTWADPALFPWRKLQQRSREAARRLQDADAMEDTPPGDPKLIRQIALRHMRNGLDVDPQEIVVTVGATEGLNLCLRAVARAGDTIAVESPCFYLMRKVAERLGMRVVELQTHPSDGIDIGSLQDLLRRQRIDACITMPNIQNPLGFVMPDERKQALVELAQQHGMPLIEDGVCNELHYGTSPPRTLKSFDTTGNVLHVGSFSKSLGVGVGVGWILAGRWRAQVEQLKFIGTSATSAVAQAAVAEFLAQDGWDHRLRATRQVLRQRADIMRGMVRRFFPEGTTMSDPQGGYFLWLELPKGVDALALSRDAMAQGVSVAPGTLFGNAGLYRHCLRINYSFAWNAQIEGALKRLADLAVQAAQSAQAAAQASA